MLPLHLALLPACDPARFLRVEAGLIARGARGPVLVVAGFSSPVVLVGRHQRLRTVVDRAAARAQGLPLLRRAGGGRSLLAAAGTVGVFLYTPPGEVLVAPAFPADRITNRYVRGLLSALRALGAERAAYFGRDFVSADKRQLAIVSQEATGAGALAFEALVAVEQPLLLPAGLAARGPEHTDTRAGGPPAASLSDFSQEAVGFDRLAGALAQGWGTLAGREPVPLPEELPEDDLPPAEEDEVGLSTSGPVEIPIGFLEVLSGFASGGLVGPRLRGDFISPAETVRSLEASLEGAPLDAVEIGRRVDAAFHAPGAFLHGVRELGTVAMAVMAAGSGAASATGVA
jgi:hypothetical protein